MKKLDRQTSLLLFLILGLLAAVPWCYSRISHGQASAGLQQSDLQECQRIIARIKLLQHRPNKAGAEELAATELIKQIEMAAKASELPPENLLRISPESARRVADSVYLEKPTQVMLRSSTLKQITSLLYHLSHGSAGLQVRLIRLTAPREQENSDRWNVEATVSYLIYQPRTERERGL